MEVVVLNQTEIIDAFISGDSEAFRTIYEETKEFVFSVIYRMVKNREETEDLMHDIYIKIFDKRDRYDSNRSAIKTWIYRIAVNHTLNHIKRNRWLGNNLFKMLSPNHEDDNLEKIEKSEDAKLAQLALEKIKPDFRVCVVMRDIEDRSYEEIAEVLKIKIGTVRSRINRGRNQLKKILERM